MLKTLESRKAHHRNFQYAPTFKRSYFADVPPITLIFLPLALERLVNIDLYPNSHEPLLWCPTIIFQKTMPIVSDKDPTGNLWINLNPKRQESERDRIPYLQYVSDLVHDIIIEIRDDSPQCSRSRLLFQVSTQQSTSPPRRDHLLDPVNSHKFLLFVTRKK